MLLFLDYIVYNNTALKLQNLHNKKCIFASSSSFGKDYITSLTLLLVKKSLKKLELLKLKTKYKE